MQTTYGRQTIAYKFLKMLNTSERYEVAQKTLVNKGGYNSIETCAIRNTLMKKQTLKKRIQKFDVIDIHELLDAL